LNTRQGGAVNSSHASGEQHGRQRGALDTGVPATRSPVRPLIAVAI
jgi:hypothetical protein